MVIHINPNRIRTASGGAGSLSGRRPQGPSDYAAPARAHVNHIPAPESLSTLIRSAVEAFRNGFTWDRGTILNLLV